jgi:hypothetical protein
MKPLAIAGLALIGLGIAVLGGALLVYFGRKIA